MKKLLVCDVEGTIFTASYKIEGLEYASSMWQPLAHSLGATGIAREVELANKWERGEFNTYIEWVQESYLFHKELGLKKSDFSKVLNEATYIPGIVKFFKNLDHNQYIPVLISGGFQELVDRARLELGIKHGHGACAYLFDEQTELLNDCRLVACDFDGKIDYMRCALREYNLNEDTDLIFVGDGKNDIPIAKKAPISFAINGHEELLQVVTHKNDNLGAAITSFDQIGEILSRLSESDFEKKWKKQQNESMPEERDIVSNINGYFLDITKLFSSWLEGTLTKIRKNWWNEYVEPNIQQYLQYEKTRKIRALNHLDLSTLLSIAKLIWRRSKNSHLNKGQETKINLIYRMHNIRNRWAHISPGYFPKMREISDDLRALEKFIQVFNESNIPDYKNLAGDIKRFRMSLGA